MEENKNDEFHINKNLRKGYSRAECRICCGIMNAIPNTQHTYRDTIRDKQGKIVTAYESDILVKMEDKTIAINYHGCKWHEIGDEHDVKTRNYFENVMGWEYIIVRSMGYSTKTNPVGYEWTEDNKELRCPEITDQETANVVIDMLLTRLGVESSDKYHPSEGQVADMYDDIENSLWYKRPDVCEACKIPFELAINRTSGSNDVIPYWCCVEERWSELEISSIVDNYDKHLKCLEEEKEYLKTHSLWYVRQDVCEYYCIPEWIAENYLPGSNKPIGYWSSRKNDWVTGQPVYLISHYDQSVRRAKKREENLKLHNLWVEHRDACEHFKVPKEVALTKMVGSIGKIKYWSEYNHDYSECSAADLIRKYKSYLKHKANIDEHLKTHNAWVTCREMCDYYKISEEEARGCLPQSLTLVKCWSYTKNDWYEAPIGNLYGNYKHHIDYLKREEEHLEKNSLWVLRRDLCIECHIPEEIAKRYRINSVRDKIPYWSPSLKRWLKSNVSNIVHSYDRRKLREQQMLAKEQKQLKLTPVAEESA